MNIELREVSHRHMIFPVWNHNICKERKLHVYCDYFIDSDSLDLIKLNSKLETYHEIMRNPDGIIDLARNPDGIIDAICEHPYYDDTWEIIVSPKTTTELENPFPKLEYGITYQGIPIKTDLFNVDYWNYVWLVHQPNLFVFYIKKDNGFYYSPPVGNRLDAMHNIPTYGIPSDDFVRWIRNL